MSIKEKQDRLPTLYWLPKLLKRPYKARFIANSSSCTTTVLSKLLTSCLTAVKKHWIRYYDTVYERDGINYFWSIKNSNDVLNKFKSKNFQASKLSTYDFSTLYTTLPHHLIKDKLIDLINRTFIRENTQYLACNEQCAFFTSDVYNNHNLWSCQKVCDALVYLLDNIFIRFGTKLYGQTIGIPMGTNCAPLVADLFLFCYERDFMKSLSRENQADIIEALNSTSRYLDDLLNIDNIYFDRTMLNAGCEKKLREVHNDLIFIDNSNLAKQRIPVREFYKQDMLHLSYSGAIRFGNNLRRTIVGVMSQKESGT